MEHSREPLVLLRAPIHAPGRVSAGLCQQGAGGVVGGGGCWLEALFLPQSWSAGLSVTSFSSCPNLHSQSAS